MEGTPTLASVASIVGTPKAIVGKSFMSINSEVHVRQHLDIELRIRTSEFL